LNWWPVPNVIYFKRDEVDKINSVSEGLFSTCGQHACAKSTEEPLAQKNKEYLASNQQKDIDSKTEELFHLIAKMDRELPSDCNKDDRHVTINKYVLSSLNQMIPNGTTIPPDMRSIFFFYLWYWFLIPFIWSDL
jgi:hypothetical protein